MFITTDRVAARWSFEANQSQIAENLYANSIRYSADGRFLIVSDFDGIALRANQDDLPLRAMIHPLLDGGWIATSVDGAVDGSSTAQDHAMTVVEGAEHDVFVHGGSLGWDRLAIDGLIARIMLGRARAPD